MDWTAAVALPPEPGVRQVRGRGRHPVRHGVRGVQDLHAGHLRRGVQHAQYSCDPASRVKHPYMTIYT